MRIMVAAFALLSVFFLSIENEHAQQKSPVRVGGPCEDCELMYEGMPTDLHWETRIAGLSEPGEPLEISGTILQPDGKTPAPGVVLYVHHTDARGEYTPSPGQTHARRHGRLRGWMKTNQHGQYKFRTIKPVSYPSQTIEAHIHATVKEPDIQEYYVDDFLFDDDPLLTAEKRRRLANRGGSGIMKLHRNSHGTLIGQRTIVLGRNIPGYETASVKKGK